MREMRYPVPGRWYIMNKKMPILFIGHGSPMNSIADNSYTKSLVALGKTLPKPKAIMVVSAHWLTPGTFVTCNEAPRTIHDFYGFPKELYALHYPSPGCPEEASFASDTAKKGNITCKNDWGLDHAAWAVLRHLYPAADIPVFEMSLHYSFNEWHPKSLQYHYDLAKELAVLRKRGVLIMGSGNIVHNLGMIDFENTDATPFGWAEDFDAQVKENLISGNHTALIQYETLGKGTSLAVPTLDHYLPMIYAIALQEKGDSLTFIHEGFQNASISMRSFLIG
jgi:4,5-DOPA dioxygenase extradiol